MKFTGKQEKNDTAPAVRLLDELINRAYSIGASDIHVEPFETKTSIRLRLDGTMTEYKKLDKAVSAPLLTRIKILAELDIAERRVPQDGHIRVLMGEEMLNIRVSVIPTVFGEKAVLRLLAEKTAIDYPQQYGMKDQVYHRFEKLLQLPCGMIYLSGPTGSGKSTTLYMILERLAGNRQVNISTIEDPVEKNVPGVNQMQVNNAAGLTFETGLRALLRQDPDILMIGETRDTQTASIAVRAAITGHLVFSTLHTNDSVSSVIRLRDMGVEPYLISGALTGVIAQRLMRKVCPACSVFYEASEDDNKIAGRQLRMIRKAVGCPVCNHTGYRGRIAVHEVLIVDRKMRDLIVQGASLEELKSYAVAGGMIPLKDAAAELVEQGITTMEELKKTVYEL